VGGFIGLPAWIGSNRFFDFLEPSLALAYIPEHKEFSHSAELGFAGLSVAVAAIGIYLAYRLYILHPNAAAALAARWRAIYKLLLRKYYVDELYDAVIVHPTLNASTEVLWKQTDVDFIDGAVNGVGEAIQGSASILKGVQNGLIRNYAAWILLGTAAVLLYISIFRS
jgi:NADH-quinone oxidoreductase subunit L